MALPRRLLQMLPNSRRGFKVFCASRNNLQHSANAKLNKHIADKYLCLPTPECVMMAEYIWVDGSGEHLRSKCRTIDFQPACVEEFPKWSFDGNYTHQPFPGNSDMLLVPAAVYNDPFRRGNNKLVLCEVYTPDMRPAHTNYRATCSQVLKSICHEEPMFGLEQDFTFMDVDRRPFGWPVMLGEPSSSGAYFCGLGGSLTFGRDIMECFYRAVLYAGVTLRGANSEVYPSMWQVQVGPTIGIKAPDDIWMTRFVLKRIAEEYGLDISLCPKLFPNWKGAGLDINFSSKSMRDEGGLKHIEEAVCRLSKRHLEHLAVYDSKGGIDNIARLDGNFDSSSVHEFTNGISGRNFSIRISTGTAERGRGYFEDRRPAANCDPYAAIEAIIRTCLIDDV